MRDDRRTPRAVGLPDRSSLAQAVDHPARRTAGVALWTLRWASSFSSIRAAERSRPDVFHVLRHTFASVQLEAGESIVSVATWLGHSSLKVTLDYYAHFMPGAGERGLAAMDRWLVCRGIESP